MKNVRNLKYKEEYEKWDNYKFRKPTRKTVYQRIKKWWELKRAISLIWNSKYKIVKAWRECTICWEFKLWSKFSHSKDTSTWYTPNCKESRNKQKKTKTQSAKK